MRNREALCDAVEHDPRGDEWSPDVQAHAVSCPGCQSFLASHRALCNRLRALPFGGEKMPEPLRERLVAGVAPVRTVAAGRRFQWRRSLAPLAMAACLALAFLIGRGLPDGRDVGSIISDRSIGMSIEDVTHDHYLLERVGRPLEVQITEAAELSRWLSSSLSFGIDLPDAGRDFHLQGGRVWHTLGRISAMASYTTADGARTILFAVPAADLRLEGAPSTLIGGTRVYTGEAWGNEARVWLEGDLAVALTAPSGRLPASWAESFLP